MKNDYHRISVSKNFAEVVRPKGGQPSHSAVTDCLHFAVSERVASHGLNLD